ncbi:DUF3530 family protein [Neptunomonas phycophila]|uniref:DUF3530 family protein n=1 Tax=Neptunomonas phycophila TaxID=1572645 RepID=UPI001BE7669C|nr:DUF3530 family protein [Neptunomonas phycophila]MBT3144278.1 alpha/beta hydrolase family protein [Neptunomonas phycophila]
MTSPLSSLFFSFLLIFATTLPSQNSQAAETEETNTTQNSASANQPNDLSSEKAPQERTEPLPQTELINALYQDSRIAGDEILDLTLDSPNFPALFKERNIALKRGIVIIFPDSRTHSNWPVFIQTLRNELPQDGWATLSLVLPIPQTPDLPARTLPSLKRLSNAPESGAEDAQQASEETPEDSPNNETQTPADEPVATEEEPNTTAETASSAEQLNNATYISQLGLAAIQAAQARGYETIILLGVGDGAVWAAALGANIKDQVDGVGLLMLDAEQSIDINAQSLRSLVPLLKLPVMDIYVDTPFTSSPQNTSASHKLRQRAANRSELSFYKQSRLPATSRTLSDQDWMSAYIKGRLRTLKKVADKPQETERPEEPSLTDQRPG